MDLTYMPGELDYKNDKKNTSDMKREHDSVDDFEHLDPELSPLDTQQKDLSSPEKLDTKSDICSVKLVGGTPTDELASAPKSSELVDISSSKDFMSDDDKELPQNKNTIGLSNHGKSSLLDFGIDQDTDNNFEVEPLNKSFIPAERASNAEKTDQESDLLNLEFKAKDSVKDIEKLPTDDDLNKLVLDEKHTNEDLDFEIKSMKEADALSQYDMKFEKKATDKKDDTASENEHSDSFYKPGNHGPELITKADIDLFKPETELQKPESDDPQTHPLKEENNLLEESKDKGLPSEKEVPLTPFIAICPSKPTPIYDFVMENIKKISNLDDIIEPEDVFKHIGLVEALIYWRDPKKSGVVFGGIMVILLSLCYMSLISVVAYSSLFALTGTFCFRIYKNILQAVQKTSEGHPFKEFLDLELSLPQDKVREMVDTAVVHVNAAIVELRRLFLVEDLIDSMKFGLCLWCLTHVGAIFNGMTIVILAFVALFTVPKIYENNKASIDMYIDLARSRITEITSKVKAAVPIGKKEPEKDKEQ